jgi:hypothetical protein
MAPDPRAIIFGSSAAVRKERPSHVDVERHVERLDVMLQCRSERVRGRVVDQHVDLTGLFGQASHGFDVVQVGGDELGRRPPSAWIAATVCAPRSV